MPQCSCLRASALAPFQISIIGLPLLLCTTTVHKRTGNEMQGPPEAFFWSRRAHLRHNVPCYAHLCDARMYWYDRDPNDTKRPVTSIAWHPEGPDRMVVSHCIVNFQQHTPDTSLDCYVYRTGRSVSPPTASLQSFRYIAVIKSSLRIRRSVHVLNRTTRVYNYSQHDIEQHT